MSTIAGEDPNNVEVRFLESIEDPNNVEVRFLESIEEPGMFCAQAFQKPSAEQNMIGRHRIKVFKGIQYSSWHPTKVAATVDLELRLKLQGFRKV